MITGPASPKAVERFTHDTPEIHLHICNSVGMMTDGNTNVTVQSLACVIGNIEAFGFKAAYVKIETIIIRE